MNWEEKGLLAIISSTTVLLLAESREYSGAVALLPRWTAIVVLLFVCVVSVREYVDTTDTAAGGSSLAQRAEEVVETTEAEDRFGILQPNRTRALPFTDGELSYRYFVALFLVIYVGLGYFVGLGVPTLVFLGLYLWLTGTNRRRSAGLFAVTLGILYVFGVWLETPLFEGIIEWMPTVGVLLP